MDGLDTFLADTARRWGLQRVAVFGSVARGEDGPHSDIDLLIDLNESEGAWSLLDLARLKVELEDATQRRVDLVQRDALVNPYRRRAILRDARTVYVAE